MRELLCALIKDEAPWLGEENVLRLARKIEALVVQRVEQALETMKGRAT